MIEGDNKRTEQLTYSEVGARPQTFSVPRAGRIYLNDDVKLVGGEPNSDERENISMPKSSSFWRWSSCLCSMVLKTRTAFAAFLRLTLKLPRCSTPASALFPIPVPFPGAFDRMPRASSSSMRLRALRQVIHIMAMALNFWWSGGQFHGMGLLERTPSDVHCSMFRRWKSLLLADGPCEVFDIASSGRKFPQLIARINELSEVLTKLGAAGGPYDRSFPGHPVPRDDAILEGLEPYRSLDVGRLKLAGTGHFDATAFLDDDLVMAYRFPDLLKYDAGSYDFSEFQLRRDSAEEVEKLARLWDSRGLLYLHRQDLEFSAPHELTRVFNCLKDKEVDRQIGDRRGRNMVEGRLQSASKTLPNGPDFVELEVKKGQKLAISVTDRRDFYHQFWVSPCRAATNSVGPSLPFALLQDLKAASLLAAGEKIRKRKPRVQRGDMLDGDARFHDGLLQDNVLVAFKGILQGDHLGVEIATQSHANLLSTAGLLDASVRMVSDRPLPSTTEVQGLCIDDFFCISLEKRDTMPEDSRSFQALTRALKTYDKFKLEGSPHKDVYAEDAARVVGAFLNSSDKAAKLGVCTVGVPPEKRYALSTLSLHVAQLSHTSDALHLSLLGAWTSSLIYRRVAMGILQTSYQLVNANSIDSNNPALTPLPRHVAQELVMLSVLTPLLVSELNAEYMDELFCSDASQDYGAICAAKVNPAVVKMLWRSCRAKGAYTRLQTPQELMLERLGIRETLHDDDGVADFRPERPMGLLYDFIEVFAGSGRVTDAVSKRGFVVCLPIDLSRSSELDVALHHVASWLAFMISEKRTKSFMVEPPCTTFSIMRRPALRDAEFPFGYDPTDPQTADGNVLAHRAFQLLKVGLVEQVTGLLETPNSSKMKNLPSWKSMLFHPDASMCRTDSCAYGSAHLKSFKFLGVHADMEPLSGRCSGDHEHLQVQGKYTMGSAVYTPRLAEALAEVMIRGISRLKAAGEELEDTKVTGLESQLVNEVALSSPWRVDSCWKHKQGDHINLHEMHSVYRLALKMARRKKALRPVCLVDSNVTRCALSKGRSSSLKLTAVLRKYGALTLACGLYFTLPFVPTRWNSSDDPTRQVKLRDSCLGLHLDTWTEEELFQLSQVQRLRRWASNWVRMVFLLLGPDALWIHDKSKYRVTYTGLSQPASEVSSVHPPPLDFRTLPSMDFDSTLGYPGEGPLMPPALFCASLFLQPVIFIILGLELTLCSFVPAAAMEDELLFPRNSGDVARAASRRDRPELPTGRPVLQGTSDNRQKLLDQFCNWLSTLNIDAAAIFSEPHQHLQLINDLLNRYGRVLYGAGRPYGHYCETINAVVSHRPSLRRSLQGAWDLAFAWVRDEKPTHHVAMPWQLLLSMITVALCWGWAQMAGGLALSFGALLRPGEFLGARRKDLLLPSDVWQTQRFALVSIQEPKTRFTVARHQCAKLDIPDLLDVVTLAFEKEVLDQPLWSMSGQTFRGRFRQILQCLGVEQILPGMTKVCDPGSLRAGGATWLLQTCEDSEFVRRRGRWINSRVMEVYVQEIASVQFMMHLSEFQRSRILTLAQCFPAVLEWAKRCRRLGLPTKSWATLWMAEEVGRSGIDGEKRGVA